MTHTPWRRLNAVLRTDGPSTLRVSEATSTRSEPVLRTRQWNAGRPHHSQSFRSVRLTRDLVPWVLHDSFRNTAYVPTPISFHSHKPGHPLHAQVQFCSWPVSEDDTDHSTIRDPHYSNRSLPEDWGLSNVREVPRLNVYKTYYSWVGQSFENWPEVLLSKYKTEGINHHTESVREETPSHSI